MACWAVRRPSGLDRAAISAVRRGATILRQGPPTTRLWDGEAGFRDKVAAAPGPFRIEVAHRRFKKWARALHIWNPHPGREHYGAARDQNADVVRAERNGFGHLGEAGAIERDALVVVPGADGFAGSKQKASAMPHQGLGIVWILGEPRLAQRHRALESGSVAGKPFEHVFAREIIEWLNRLRVGHAGRGHGETNGDQPSSKPTHVSFSLPVFLDRNSISRWATCSSNAVRPRSVSAYRVCGLRWTKRLSTET